MRSFTYIISGGSNLFAIIRIQIITLRMVIPPYPPLEKSVRLETEGG